MARTLPKRGGAAERHCHRSRNAADVQRPRASQTARETRQNLLFGFDSSCGAWNHFGSGWSVHRTGGWNETPARKIEVQELQVVDASHPRPVVDDIVARRCSLFTLVYSLATSVTVAETNDSAAFAGTLVFNLAVPGFCSGRHDDIMKWTIPHYHTPQ